MFKSHLTTSVRTVMSSRKEFMGGITWPLATSIPWANFLAPLNTISKAITKKSVDIQLSVYWVPILSTFCSIKSGFFSLPLIFVNIWVVCYQCICLLQHYGNAKLLYWALSQFFRMGKRFLPFSFHVVSLISIVVVTIKTETINWLWNCDTHDNILFKVFRVPDIHVLSRKRAAPGAMSKFGVQYVGNPRQLCEEQGKITLTIDSRIQSTLSFPIAIQVSLIFLQNSLMPFFVQYNTYSVHFWQINLKNVL